MAAIEKISEFLPQLIGGSADLSDLIIQKQVILKLSILKTLMGIIFIMESENMEWQQ